MNKLHATAVRHQRSNDRLVTSSAAWVFVNGNRGESFGGLGFDTTADEYFRNLQVPTVVPFL